MTVRLYLAGPMRDHPESNFPAFDHAAKQLRDFGYEVFSPAERDREVYGPDIGNHPDSLDIRELMKADLDWICDHAEGVAMLSGWAKSSGACAEYALASAIGIPARRVAVWIECA